MTNQNDSPHSASRTLKGEARPQAILTNIETIIWSIAVIPNLRDRALLMMLCTTGLRVSELSQLNRDFLTISEQSEKKAPSDVVGQGILAGKHGKSRHFLVGRLAMHTVADYLATRVDDNPALFVSLRRERMSACHIRYIFGLWFPRIQMHHFRLHQIRHTAALRLLGFGPLDVLATKAFHHSSPTTTLKYYIREK